MKNNNMFAYTHIFLITIFLYYGTLVYAVNDQSSSLSLISNKQSSDSKQLSSYQQPLFSSVTVRQRTGRRNQGGGGGRGNGRCRIVGQRCNPSGRRRCCNGFQCKSVQKNNGRQRFECVQENTNLKCRRFETSSQCQCRAYWEDPGQIPTTFAQLEASNQACGARTFFANDPLTIGVRVPVCKLTCPSDPRPKQRTLFGDLVIGGSQPFSAKEKDCFANQIKQLYPLIDGGIRNCNRARRRFVQFDEYVVKVVAAIDVDSKLLEGFKNCGFPMSDDILLFIEGRRVNGAFTRRPCRR